MLPRVALCTPRQIKALLTSELRRIEVERNGKTEAAALRSPDPDACRDPRVARWRSVRLLGRAGPFTIS